MNISHKIKENFYDDIPSDQVWEYLYEKMKMKYKFTVIDKLKFVHYIVGQMILPIKYRAFMILYLLEIDHNNENLYK